LFAKGDPDAAIAEYRAALRSDANSVLAHYLLGIALYGKRDLAGAYSELQAALKLNPNFGGVYKMLAQFLRFAETCLVRLSITGVPRNYRQTMTRPGWDSCASQKGPGCHKHSPSFISATPTRLPQA